MTSGITYLRKIDDDGPGVEPAGDLIARATVTVRGQARSLSDALSNAAALGHTAVADTDYQGLATDVQIGFTSLTAARTVYLPDVDTYPLGQVLFVADESGNCSETIKITIAVSAGSGDTIAGQASQTLTSPYQGQGFRRGAANLWIFA